MIYTDIQPDYTSLQRRKEQLVLRASQIGMQRKLSTGRSSRSIDDCKGFKNYENQID